MMETRGALVMLLDTKNKEDIIFLNNKSANMRIDTILCSTKTENDIPWYRRGELAGW